MKKTLSIVAVVALAVAGIGIGAKAQEDAADTRAGAWEHLALQHDLAEGFSTPELARQINGLGRDGWELVSVLRNDAGEEQQLVYYFKRPL